MEQSKLYPLKFRPILKQKLWGGVDLAAYGKPLGALQNVGESWDISACGDDVSVVSEGFLADNDLNDLVEVYMGDLVGDAVYEKFGNYFPLLFKFIDAHDNLSIQVHPDDDTAWERHQANGKTEMWYVLEAQEGAKLTLGFRNECDKETLLQAVAAHQLTQIVQEVPVKKGDVAFVPAGLVHAIGRGVVLVEIQQTSDLTYRIYDYNRIDANGKKRDLHLSQAVDVIHYEEHKTPFVAYQPVHNGAVSLVSCPYFATNLLTFDRTIARDYALLDSFVVYMCVEGALRVETETGTTTMQKGDSVLLPAVLDDVRLVPTAPQVQLLEVYIQA